MVLSVVLAAFVRFAANGAGIALVAIGTYCAGVAWLDLSPLTANLLAYVTQLAVGYQVHRLFSFANAPMTRSSAARYTALSIGAFLLNTLWIWLLTVAVHLPAWTPILPMIALTPVMTFLAARHWVFGGDGPP